MPWFSDHQSQIKQLLTSITPFCEELWVFGSALTKDEPGDLDILIVYKESIYDKMKEEVSKIEKQNIAGIYFHFTKLLQEEVQGDYSFTIEVRKTRVLLWDKTGWKI